MEIKKKLRRANARVPHWPEQVGYGESVAGVSYHTQALERIVAWEPELEQFFLATATLVPEPENPHDGNAVKVLCVEHHIGYLCKASAARYKRVVCENDAIYHPPVTTAALRVTRMLFDEGPQFSASLSLRFSQPPSDIDKVAPRLRYSMLAPRLRVDCFVRDGHAFIIAADVDEETVDRCYPGAMLDVWLAERKGDVHISAPSSIGGSGGVCVMNLDALRSLGFASLDDFLPRVYSSTGRVIICCAKLPKSA